jgi:hypothetical protein
VFGYFNPNSHTKHITFDDSCGIKDTKHVTVLFNIMFRCLASL